MVQQHVQEEVLLPHSPGTSRQLSTTSCSPNFFSAIRTTRKRFAQSRVLFEKYKNVLIWNLLVVIFQIFILKFSLKLTIKKPHNVVDNLIIFLEVIQTETLKITCILPESLLILLCDKSTNSSFVNPRSCCKENSCIWL